MEMPPDTWGKFVFECDYEELGEFAELPITHIRNCDYCDSTTRTYFVPDSNKYETTEVGICE